MTDYGAPAGSNIAWVCANQSVDIGISVLLVVRSWEYLSPTLTFVLGVNSVWERFHRTRVIKMTGFSYFLWHFWCESQASRIQIVQNPMIFLCFILSLAALALFHQLTETYYSFPFASRLNHCQLKRFLKPDKYEYTSETNSNWQK